ncbi:hypothetical protein VNO80_25509 [Phaseolus coccineus]|uniref:Uncharacterized protein n=1 Tax=Phaseolus coccineus TaxID=3886 RepID=A0AAN9LUX9_PHACN
MLSLLVQASESVDLYLKTVHSFAKIHNLLILLVFGRLSILHPIISHANQGKHLAKQLQGVMRKEVFTLDHKSRFVFRGRKKLSLCFFGVFVSREKRGEGERFWRQVLFWGGCDLDCFGEVKDMGTHVTSSVKTN